MLFSDFNISKPLLNALNDLQISEATAIQQKSFPAIKSGRDIIGIAQTGTGKTIAYLLPCLQQWKFSKEKNPSILILVPTRELVLQVENDLQNLTKYMNIRIAGVYGGVNMIRQSPLIAAGLDVLVATPGRLLDFALNGTLKLSSVKKIIIDEVDEMLNLGFRPQLIRIIDLLPKKRQNLMFSATLSDELQAFIDDFFYTPLQIEAARSGTPLQNIKQAGVVVPNFYTKINLLKFLLDTKPEFSKVLVFVSTKKLADDVFECLNEKFEEQLGVIHSNKSQNYRISTYNSFNNNEIRLLIATDLVARGLDFDDITHVVNFDFPDKPEEYIHRIGRTGRIDKNGVALSFITKQDDEILVEIEQLMGKKIALMQIPEEVEISTKLIPDELPKPVMKTSLVKSSNLQKGGGAFHEKQEKNKKENKKVRYKDLMHQKYGKPQTRGQKK
jgi:Superfamily II DNA and RNA helicases